VAHTHPPGGLNGCYRQNVMGGRNRFVMVARDFASFGRARRQTGRGNFVRRLFHRFVGML
jgi:hypothetical protein